MYFFVSKASSAFCNSIIFSSRFRRSSKSYLIISFQDSIASSSPLAHLTIVFVSAKTFSADVDKLGFAARTNAASHIFFSAAPSASSLPSDAILARFLHASSSHFSDINSSSKVSDPVRSSTIPNAFRFVTSRYLRSRHMPRNLSCNFPISLFFMRCHKASGIFDTKFSSTLLNLGS